MLKPSECIPGVEVIAIKNYPYMMPALDIGAVYTIYEFANRPFVLVCDHSKIVKGPFIFLEEIAERNCLKCKLEVEPVYCLDQFKIRNVKEFEDLFNIHSVKIPELV